MTARVTDAAGLAAWRQVHRGARVGLVPTMGALHAGHDALVRKAVADCDAVVASVFVNPLQFDERGDFERYPRDLDRDGARLAALGVAAIYAPEESELYPPGFDTRVAPGAAARTLEGACRPGHFEGVLTVVLKLLQRVRPTDAYFGEKDAQQLHLVRRMVADLDLPVRIFALPTVREADGLALSSRNARLDAPARERAAGLCRGLVAAAAAFDAGERDPRALQAAAGAVLAAAGVEPEYVAVVDDRDFAPADAARGGVWRAVVAARIGGVRLIDNRLLGPA